MIVPDEILKWGSVYESDGKWIFECKCEAILLISDNNRYRFSNVNKHLKKCSASTDLTFLEPASLETPLLPFSAFSFLELAEYDCPFWKQDYTEPFYGSVKNLDSLFFPSAGMIVGYLLAYV